jgi:hypothetical protein
MEGSPNADPSSKQSNRTNGRFGIPSQGNLFGGRPKTAMSDSEGFKKSDFGDSLEMKFQGEQARPIERELYELSTSINNILKSWRSSFPL